MENSGSSKLNVVNGVHDNVQDYYSHLTSTEGNKALKTDACCSTEALPDFVKEALALIHVEIHEKFYGCGSPLPLALEGCTVLDLGCGTGRDCYVASKLVGEHGRVIGIDMTDDQLDVARCHIDFHTKAFGFSKPNVEFHKAFIEDVSTAGVEDNSVDVVISNCVLNLAPQKEKVFEEIFRVLKPGGELYFSDVFSASRIPVDLMKDPVLLGECLSGALYVEDFRRMLQALDCPDYRTVSSRPLVLHDKEVLAKIGMIQFYSDTVRAFKLATLEDRCEDYGQVATYLGTLAESPHSFYLDDNHEFIAGKPHLVCGNTASMLQETRFSKHFSIQGDRSKHFGLFDCEPKVVKEVAEGACC